MRGEDRKNVRARPRPTGGTIDKLESFPGFSTALSDEQFFENVNRLGIAIIGQTADLDPADKSFTRCAT